MGKETKIDKDFLGSGYILSTDTLRREDIIEAYKHFIEELLEDDHLKNKNHHTIKRINHTLNRASVYLEFRQIYLDIMEEPLDDYDIKTVENIILIDMESLITDLTPEKYVYSSHPGDGACFGIWKEESISLRVENI